MLLTLCAGLDHARWELMLVYRPAPSLASFLAEMRGAGVRLMPLPPRPRGRVAGVGGEIVHLVRLLRAERPSVLHANMVWPLACKTGLLAGRLAGVPAVVCTEHCLVNVRSRREIRLQQLLSVAVDRYVTVSEYVAGGLREHFGLPERKIRVVRNGICVARFERPSSPALREQLCAGAGRRVVLTVARLDPGKGHRYLLSAAAQVPDALFVLAGEGPERAALEQQARQLGIEDRVVFLGQREDVPELLASCDLFVLPSLNEGLPLSILEAMAAGRPVLATDVGGVGETVVAGETALLVPPRDPEGLARAMRAVLDDPARARRLGAAGQARARQEFDASGMVARVERIYDEVLGSA